MSCAPTVFMYNVTGLPLYKVPQTCRFVALGKGLAAFSPAGGGGSGVQTRKAFHEAGLRCLLLKFCPRS